MEKKSILDLRFSYAFNLVLRFSIWTIRPYVLPQFQIGTSINLPSN
jgi:hypothetical protein